MVYRGGTLLIKIEIAEIIPRTIQGEGEHIGRVVSILRFAGCNLKCTWCDTKWASEVRESVSLENLVKLLPEKDVVLTGGEPTINKQFVSVVRKLLIEGKRVHVETNGTNLKEDWLISYPSSIRWSISPKLSSAGNSFSVKKMREFMDVWRKFACGKRNAFFKFVIGKNVTEDLAEAMAILDMVDSQNVYFQPVDNDIEVYRKMVSIGPSFARYTLQLHKLVRMK